MGTPLTSKRNLKGFAKKSGTFRLKIGQYDQIDSENK